MKQYYYSEEGKQEGPFSLDELKTKNITQQTLVWYEGLDNWTAGEKIPELADYFKRISTSVPPPLPKNEFQVTSPPIPNANKVKSNSKKKKLVLFSFLGLLILFAMFIAINIARKQARKEAYDEAVTNELSEQLSRKAETAQQKQALKSKITDYLAVSLNNYDVAPFGGISNLKVTVQNNSPYTMQSVKVQVNYIKDNGSIYQTESATFSDLRTGQKQTLNMPSTSRGTSVKYMLSGIDCAELGISFSR